MKAYTDKRSKIFFRGLVTLLFVPIIAVIALVAWQGGPRTYFYIRMITSIGSEQHYWQAEYNLSYTRGALRTPLLLQRMQSSLDLGFPIEGILEDYAEIHRIYPRFYALDGHLPALAEKFAEKGYYNHCILIFETLLTETENSTTSPADFLEFQKGLSPAKKRDYTYKKLEEAYKRLEGDWVDAWGNVRETYASFLVKTKNPLARNPKRALELARTLEAKGSNPLRARLMADVLATNGKFEEAVQALNRTERLYLEIYPTEKSTLERPNPFLDIIAEEKIIFTARKVILSRRF